MARSALLNVMVQAAMKAGRKLSRDFGEIESLQVSVKGPGDFVTNADKEAEKIIYQELSKARPEIGFLMEEGGEIKGKDPQNRWIIDPIDGTTNFMHSIPVFLLSGMFMMYLLPKQLSMCGVKNFRIMQKLFISMRVHCVKNIRN